MALVTVAELKAVLGVGNLYADEQLQSVCDAAGQVVGSYVTLEIGEEPEAVKQAALAIALDIWQSRQAPFGTPQGADFQPGPYRMGRSLISRVTGLIAPYMNVGSMVG